LGEWLGIVASGQWPVNLREGSWRRQKSAKTKPIWSAVICGQIEL